MKSPKHSLYKEAESLFIEQGMTCVAIAELLNLTEATLSKWRNMMGWDEKRMAYLSAPAIIRQILMAELQSIASGNKPRIDTDALSKVSKALSYFDGKVALSIVVSVFKECDNWLMGIDPQKAAEMVEFHRLFVNYRAEIDTNK